MSSFENWLEQKPSPFQTILILLSLILLSLITYLSLGTIINYPFGWNGLVNITPYTTMIIAKNAFGEEVIFRFIPFFAILKIINKKSVIFYLFVLAMSLIFAYLHIGLPSLIALGPIGLMLSISYLKFGGYRNNHLRAFLLTGAGHTLINFSLYYIGSIITT